jgi:serine/threonine protein phosphatase 1
MTWPMAVDYPIVAIPDLHGQRGFLERLLGRLEALPEWPRCAVVFLGDFVDRGPDVRGTIDQALSLAARHPRVAAVMGNHDLALVRAARLDGGPPSASWIAGYRDRYDHGETFLSYLGRRPGYDDWEGELEALRAAIPDTHRNFLVSLPWLVEAPGHLFLHCGLSPELDHTAEDQLAALRQRRWDETLRPLPGTRTAALWQLDYPVWLGADRRLSDRPLAFPGRVQVTGHVHLAVPEADTVRIRLDTSGGYREPLTACLLRSAGDPPVFITSR